jgi:hypothetical protein
MLATCRNEGVGLTIAHERREQGWRSLMKEGSGDGEKLKREIPIQQCKSCKVNHPKCKFYGRRKSLIQRVLRASICQKYIGKTHLMQQHKSNQCEYNAQSK